jgi:hypothetical protein
MELGNGLVNLSVTTSKHTLSFACQQTLLRVVLP